jgi:hypothetical protein
MGVPAVTACRYGFSPETRDSTIGTTTHPLFRPDECCPTNHCRGLKRNLEEIRPEIKHPEIKHWD